MSVVLRPACPLDAGAVGEILHGFETDTPWMPKQHSAAEALGFCSMMIERGWVTVAEMAPAGPQPGSDREQAGEQTGEQAREQAGGDGPVARAGGRDIAGFLAREGQEVHALYVRPDRTGQGIGRMLLHAAMAQSPRLWLWTFQANLGAQRFYLREGFAEVQRTDGAGNDEGLPDIQYAWPAEAA